MSEAIAARDALFRAIAQQAELATMNSDHNALEVLARAYVTLVSAPAPAGGSGGSEASGATTATTIPLQRGNPPTPDNPSTPETPATTEGQPQVQARAGGHQVGLCLELEP